MTYDSIDLVLKSIARERINTQPRMVNNHTAQKALDIMNDLKSRKIKLRQPTNSVELQVVQDLASLSKRHERFKNYMPFPDYIARPIVATFNEAVMLGMIEDNSENEKLKVENRGLKEKVDELQKQIVRLREQLSIQEKIDKPSDTFVSDVEEAD